ncbi:aldose 1-epimerase [Nitzschia inconspicua]|uniref:Aldose 1-epimerase n=1 Tax=Nitzschia inconspicua TaxID=303405 RepID=A0A9K3LJT4_9STRA|nr:aldose 1-epimerase [Nitzschia inconspicua]
MKLSLLSIAALSSLSMSSAFVVRPSLFSSSSTTTALSMASKRAVQREKRTKWMESRGMGAGAGVAEPSASAAAGMMKNEEGLDFVRLVSPSGASAEVYLYGGVVTSYKDAEGTEFIAVRPDAKMDGSKPISGGLSHCWPQFGPGEIQQHGFARNVMWDVKSSTDTTVELEMLPSDYTKEMWDKEFACTFSVTLEDDQLKTNMLVKNTGSEGSFDFQAALHSYFTVSSLEKLEIAGSFQGKEFLNKLVGDGGEMQTEDRSSITITEEYDRVYKGVNDPVLKDAGTGKALNILNQAGWEDTVIWNPYGNEGMGYNEFVCVESVKFDPVTLDAGSSWEGVLVLKPESL